MTVAAGFFDGVHIGHQAILKGADAVLTFRAHPLSVLAPEKAPRLLMDFEDRIAAIRGCGVGDVAVFDFTPEFAALSPDEFLAKAGITTATHVRCGGNWRFGRGGKGDAEYLRARGYSVEVVPYALYVGAEVSSTRIRAALERGEIEDANAMLGRPFAVHGKAVAGKGEGGRIGFPTVNIVPEGLNVHLPHGVYAVESGGRRAVANYGLAPTFGDRAWKTPVLEVHFLEGGRHSTDGDRQPEARDPRPVSLLRFLRAERVFATEDELRAQIAHDCERAMAAMPGVSNSGG